MGESIVVYRVLSRTYADDQNFSYATVMSLIDMGILVASHQNVVRENGITVTIYYFERT